jgi:hypothetical protein
VIDDGHSVKWGAATFSVKRSNAKWHGFGDQVVWIKVVFNVDAWPFIFIQIHTVEKLQKVLWLKNKNKISRTSSVISGEIELPDLKVATGE